MAEGHSGYTISPLAETDLEDIWTYTFETWSLEQAEIYHARILAAIDSLANGRRVGRRTGIREGYFKYAIGAHLVFYRRTESGIEVIRILHQRMDAGGHL